MTEINQLKERIINSGAEGIPTAHIRDDYEPAGQMMLNQLVDSGKFIILRDPNDRSIWKIWEVGSEP